MAESFASSKEDTVVADLKSDLGNQIKEGFKTANATDINDRCLIASLMAIL